MINLYCLTSKKEKELKQIKKIQNNSHKKAGQLIAVCHASL